ncbi:MAG: DUF1501 domain-containing protein [Acidobacteria bacterium]|nr:DUF1501 domain-containing protein [Acidobacteriota bacterium]
MSIDRRDFIRSCCAAASVGVAASFSRFGLINALAQATDYRAMVCIFLFGGNDGNNVIVPIPASAPVGFRYSDYFNIRGDQTNGGIALMQAQLLAATALTAQPSGVKDFGFHPALAQTRGLFQSGKSAVIANVGPLFQPLTRAEYLSKSKPRPANLFSHSDQQQQFQTSIPNGLGTTGWAGRTADVIQPLNAGALFPPITTLAGTAIFCTGSQTNPFAMTPGSTPGLSGFPASPGTDARYVATNQLLTFDTGISLIQAASDITSRAISQSGLLVSALGQAPALATTFPTTSIGSQLLQVAKIIQVRNALNLKRQIFFCSMGGFDTHSTQINDQNMLLSQLDPAVKAFYDATVELGLPDKITTFTMSEFGRTLKPASNAGSDHGWGSHQLVFGGAVKGGDVYGRIPEFTLGGPDDASSNGRWIPTLSIDQFGATLATWFGVSGANLPAIFPNLSNFSTSNIGFI